MVNWPYVYAAAQESVASGAISRDTFEDIAWARYPRVDAAQPSAPPLGGINLAIGNFTKHPDEAMAALRCLLSVQAGAGAGRLPHACRRRVRVRQCSIV